MKVTIFNGSPRKNGNTSELVKKVLCSLDEKASCEVISLYDKNIKGCSNCGACRDKTLPSYCAMKDDMSLLYEKYLDSDVVILASPIYMWQFTPCTLAFLNRLHCLCRHSDSYNIMGGRGMAVLTTMADEIECSHFSIKGLKEFCDYFDIDYLGEVAVPYADKEKINSDDTVKEISLFTEKIINHTCGCQ